MIEIPPPGSTMERLELVGILLREVWFAALEELEDDEKWLRAKAMGQ